MSFNAMLYKVLLGRLLLLLWPGAGAQKHALANLCVGHVLGQITAGTNGVYGGARWCSHANAVWVVFETTFDVVAWGKEGVEALNEARMAGEQVGDAANNARSINSTIEK